MTVREMVAESVAAKSRFLNIVNGVGSSSLPFHEYPHGRVRKKESLFLQRRILMVLKLILKSSDESNQQLNKLNKQNKAAYCQGSTPPACGALQALSWCSVSAILPPQSMNSKVSRQAS